MRSTRLFLMSATAMLCLAFAAAPALSATKVIHTPARVAMSWKVNDLTLLSDSLQVQAAKPRSTAAQRKLSQVGQRLLYADYKLIAKEQHIKASSAKDFSNDQENTDRQDRPINIDKLLAQMTDQHCQLSRQFKGVKFATGIWPIVKQFWSLRNQALAKLHKPKLALPKQPCRPQAASAQDAAPGPGGGTSPTPGDGSQQAVPLTTGAAIDVHSTFSEVQGGIPAYSETVTVEFQYGTTTAYGRSSAPQQIPATGLSSGITGTLLGLSPNTTYHYRLSVITSTGTLYANDATLTTQPPARVTVSLGSQPLQVTHGRTQMSFGCRGELDDICKGHMQLTATQTLHRHHRRVVIATAPFSASVGHDRPYPFQQGHGMVTISLNRTGRLLLAKTGSLRTVATFIVERGNPRSTRVVLRREWTNRG